MKISYLKEQQEIENKDELIEKIKSCITGVIVSNPKKVKFFTPSTLFKYDYVDGEYHNFYKILLTT